MAKILVVDDDPAGQRLIKYMLMPDGHEVVTASNGIQGLQVAGQQLPDLVILDVMLPGLDGFEVCRRLRAGASTKNMPIIMLSGKTQASDHDTGLKMGANEYLVKPVDRQILLETVNSLIQSTGENTEKKAKVIAFIGARGGAGTSTVTTNVSVALEKMGKQTVLVDMNPSYSVLGDMVGMTIEESVADVVRGPAGTVKLEILKGLIKNHDSGLQLLWAETFPDESETYNPDDVKALFGELQVMTDVLIVDVPASPSENAIALLALADEVMLLTGAGKDSIERITSAVTRLNRFGVTSDKLKIIIVDRTGSDETDVLAGEKTLGGLSVAGVIHYCKDECAAAEAEGNPVVLASPSAQISQDIERVASYISSMM